MKRILAASAVVRDRDGRYLLVQRANPPEAGHWTLPGGSVDEGESLSAAASREVLEETGFLSVLFENWANSICRMGMAVCMRFMIFWRSALGSVEIQDSQTAAVLIQAPKREP